MSRRNKITIVGAGNVGATAAHWAAQKHLGDVVLVGDASPYAALAPSCPRLRDARSGIGPLGGLVALLAGCDNGPSRVAGPNYSLDGDAGTQCKDEGCACEPGTEPESCLIGTPIVRGNQYLCQRGTRSCRRS